MNTENGTDSRNLHIPARIIAESKRVVPSLLPEGKRHMAIGFVKSCMAQCKWKFWLTMFLLEQKATREK